MKKPRSASAGEGRLARGEPCCPRFGRALKEHLPQRPKRETELRCRRSGSPYGCARTA